MVDGETELAAAPAGTVVVLVTNVVDPDEFTTTTTAAVDEMVEMVEVPTKAVEVVVTIAAPGMKGPAVSI